MVARGVKTWIGTVMLTGWQFESLKKVRQQQIYLSSRTALLQDKTRIQTYTVRAEQASWHSLGDSWSNFAVYQLKFSSFIIIIIIIIIILYFIHRYQTVNFNVTDIRMHIMYRYVIQ
jgi:hypothetical protein